jgi:hypothetical protein
VKGWRRDRANGLVFGIELGEGEQLPLLSRTHVSILVRQYNVQSGAFSDEAIRISSRQLLNKKERSSRARAIGGASLPLFSRYLLDQNVLFKEPAGL